MFEAIGKFFHMFAVLFGKGSESVEDVLTMGADRTRQGVLLNRLDIIESYKDNGLDKEVVENLLEDDWEFQSLPEKPEKPKKSSSKAS